MRRKKTDYTGVYSPGVKHSTSLSQDIGKHKSASVKSIDASVLDSFSRYHSGKYSQYRFKVSGNSLILVISQCGKINSKVRELTIGDITASSQFKLCDRITLSKKKTDGTIFDVATLIGVETDLLIRQCQDYSHKHAYIGDPSVDKPTYKSLSGSNWKLKKRI